MQQLYPYLLMTALKLSTGFLDCYIFTCIKELLHIQAVPLRKIKASSRIRYAERLVSVFSHLEAIPCCLSPPPHLATSRVACLLPPPSSLSMCTGHSHGSHSRSRAAHLHTNHLNHHCSPTSALISVSCHSQQ